VAVAVDDATADDDPFAERLSIMLPRQVGVAWEHRHAPEHGPGQLMEPFRRKPDQLACRRPPNCGAVVRVEIRGLGVSV
jgi:hypothetical protein